MASKYCIGLESSDARCRYTFPLSSGGKYIVKPLRESMRVYYLWMRPQMGVPHRSVLGGFPANSQQRPVLIRTRSVQAPDTDADNIPFGPPSRQHIYRTKESEASGVSLYLFIY